MKSNQSNTIDCYKYCFYQQYNYEIIHFFFFRSSSPVPHLYSAHLVLLSTLAFRRRRKETISTEDDLVQYTDIPKERGVVQILVMQ
jgi:hypothetical protein